MTKTASNTPKSVTVNLSKPVKIDGEDVTKITLRKPMVGELRGQKLIEVIQMDVNAMIAVIPRISVPPLMDHQLANGEIEPEDFMDMAAKVATFFAKGPAGATPGQT